MVISLSDVLAPKAKKIPYSGIETDKAAIDNLLIQYGLKVDNISQGYSIIQYKATMQPDTNLNKLMKLENNLRIALNDDNVYITTKGNQFIIQKPCNQTLVSLADFYNIKFLYQDGLKLIMGKDIDGNNLYTDLAKQPHMLVAGTTGSGKSMFLHQCIISLLSRNPDIEIYGIDSKQVEFKAYQNIRSFHYITTANEAALTLKKLVGIMESRYELFAKYSYRDIESAIEDGKEIAPIVCIIDELADLIMSNCGKAIEADIVRIAQKARAAGIHLILATQRPTSDVITGLIKANVPSRVCFKVASAMESRIILDSKGGETLLGKGDMLYKSNGSFEPVRIQSCFISEKEMNDIGSKIAASKPKRVEPTTAEPKIVYVTEEEVRNGAYTDSPNFYRCDKYDPELKEIYNNKIIQKRKQNRSLFHRIFG